MKTKPTTATAAYSRNRNRKGFIRSLFSGLNLVAFVAFHVASIGLLIHLNNTNQLGFVLDPIRDIYHSLGIGERP